jgi:hypothetical protein
MSVVINVFVDDQKPIISGILINNLVMIYDKYYAKIFCNPPSNDIGKKEGCGCSFDSSILNPKGNANYIKDIQRSI